MGCQLTLALLLFSHFMILWLTEAFREKILNEWKNEEIRRVRNYDPFCEMDVLGWMLIFAFVQWWCGKKVRKQMKVYLALNKVIYEVYALLKKFSGWLCIHSKYSSARFSTISKKCIKMPK